jgi:hypothetical protein
VPCPTESSDVDAIPTKSMTRALTGAAVTPETKTRSAPVDLDRGGVGRVDGGIVVIVMHDLDVRRGRRRRVLIPLLSHGIPPINANGRARRPLAWRGH